MTLTTRLLDDEIQLMDLKAAVDVTAATDEVLVTVANLVCRMTMSAFAAVVASTASLITPSSVDTLTNKSISLANNTLTGTLAQFNTALSDADFASLAGAESLSNKTLPSPTVSGTAAGSFTLSGVITFTQAPVFTDASGTRTALGLGTAAVVTLGSNWATALAASYTTTGSGAYALATSPTFVTPILGIAAATSLDLNGETGATLSAASSRLTMEGVNLVTISSIDTLTNKTLSSPTLSGTVAGSVTFSGALTITGGPTIFQGAAPHIYLYESDAATDNKYWRILATVEDLYFGAVNDALSAADYWCVVSRTGTTIDAISLSATALTWNGNTVLTTATGAPIPTAAAMVTSGVTLNNGAAAAAGTLLNAPAAGNPTKWIPVNDNGTTRYIPAW